VLLLGAPALQKQIVEMGPDMPESGETTPEALDALRKADIDKWWAVIQAAGLN
jgi:hypothetical protein